MADNVVTNPGTGGDTIAADDVSGVKYQVVKLDVGGNGASSPVTDLATSANQTTANSSLSTIATNTGSATPAGTNLIGKVGLDQTTPGTTNNVSTSVSTGAGTSALIKDAPSFGDGVSSGIASTHGLLYNGTNYDRAKGDATNGAYVNVKAAPTSLTTPLSTIQTNTTWGASDFFPQYNRNDGGGGAVPSTNPAGQLLTEASIITDGGSQRINFTGSSLLSSLGTCTFTTGSTTVTGSGFANSSLEVPFFVKLNADSETAYTPVRFIDSDTQLTLAYPYAGSSATGAASYSPVATVTGTGGTFAVGSGVMTLACGTTASAQHVAYGVASTGDLEMAGKLTLSQRIANQDIYFGLEDNALTTISAYSRFHFTGTTNTQVICETAYNPTTTPSASEQENTTVTLPGLATTATANLYKILVTQDQITFYINGIPVAVHTQRIPHIRRTSNTGFTTLDLRCLNGTTPATSTTVTVDYMTGRIYNRIDTYQGTPAPDNGSDGYFMDAVTSTVTVTSTKGRLMGIHAINLNSVPSYIQVFDTTGAVTLGTTVPRYVFAIPANSTAANGAGIVAFTASGLNIINGIKIACTTTAKGASTSATGISGTLLYRNL